MGRDVPAMTVSQQDRRAYREKVRQCLDVFARMLRESRFDPQPHHVGLEIELNLVDADCMPAMTNTNVLDAIADPSWATELGRFNLEINVPPQQLTGDALGALEAERAAASSAHAAERARSTGSRMVMIGILPTVRQRDVTAAAMSANPRYRLLNDQMIAARGEDMRICIDGPERLLTHVDTIMPEAACTSVQFHLQVSPEAFGSYWNAAQAVAGIQVALAANSPFLFGRELWRETRDPALRAGHRHPAGGTQAARRPAPGLVRRAVDHLGFRPVRREPAVLPGAAAAARGRGSRGRAGQRRGAAAGRADAAQRHGLPVEPPGLRGRRRQAAPAGGEPGAARRADRRGRAGQRRVLLRHRPGAGRYRAPGMDADVLRGRRREPGRGRPARDRRQGLLARRRRDRRCPSWRCGGCCRRPGKACGSGASSTADADRMLGIIEQRCLSGRTGATWQVGDRAQPGAGTSTGGPRCGG